MQTYEVNLRIACLAEICAKNRRNVTAAIEALRWLRGLEHPDTVALNSVLEASAKVSSPVPLATKAAIGGGACSGAGAGFSSSSWLLPSPLTAAEQAEMLLEGMKELHRKKFYANRERYDNLHPPALVPGQVRSISCRRIEGLPNGMLDGT
eukprot:Pompholyxophrys_punicea_v1_NODE_110_length_3422_cov_27.309177.p3 type:complete len:151 gc:universal NODE_110_length_3422_cov_27.309177:2343-2795(+)